MSLVHTCITPILTYHTLPSPFAAKLYYREERVSLALSLNTLTRAKPGGTVTFPGGARDKAVGRMQGSERDKPFPYSSKVKHEQLSRAQSTRITTATSPLQLYIYSMAVQFQQAAVRAI